MKKKSYGMCRKVTEIGLGGVSRRAELTLMTKKPRKTMCLEKNMLLIEFVNFLGQ